MELRNGRSVVGHIGQGGTTSVMGATHDIGLSNESGLFEVAVGYVALGVVKGHEVILDIRRKRLPPDSG